MFTHMCVCAKTVFDANRDDATWAAVCSADGAAASLHELSALATSLAEERGIFAPLQQVCSSCESGPGSGDVRLA